MRKAKLLYVLIICFISSCTNNLQKERKAIELSDWYILGPFKSNNQNDYLQFNNLAKWGYSEEQIDFVSFVSIPPDSEITNSVYKQNLTVIDFCKHFNIDPFKDNIGGNAYAACTFEVNDTTGFYINFSSDDGGKVYLNNEEIINLEKADLVAKYEIYQPIKLKKGKNFILVKVNNGLYNWQAFVEIEKFSEESLKEHYNLMNRLNNNKFFKLSLYDTTNFLIPSESLPDTKLKYDIFSKDISFVLSGEVYKNMVHYQDISELPDGLYSVKLYLDNLELTQEIYKGDLIGELKSKIQWLESITIEDKELNATINANTFRLEHLLKPENHGGDQSEKHKWQRKLIYLYKTLIEIEKNVGSGKTVEEIPHTVLRGFVSKIDNQDQYYISHTPRGYNPETKYPVVIFAPYFLSTQRPYLESMRVADIDIQENLQHLSDRYQMIILEPFSREVSWYNLNSIGETDFFEVLNSAKKNYNIDTTRIFLAGSCAGAEKALNLAVKYPHIFAGMGLASPAFSSNISNQSWYKKNQPFEYIENIRKMPVLVMHSVNDRHTSINNSLLFERHAKENKLEHFTFIRTENDVEEYFWYKYSDKIFEFFTEIQPQEKTDLSTLKISALKYNTNQIITILEREKQQDFSKVSLKVKNNNIRIESSNVLNFSIDMNKLSVNSEKPVSIFENGKKLFNGTVNGNHSFVKNFHSNSHIILKNNLIEGPFADIFTDRFIIVIGSLGSDQETKKNEKVAQYFNEAWKNKYFNDCMVKYDYQINNLDFENANLLLLGNFESNKIINDFKGQIPIEISENQITIGNRTETGKNLNLYLIYPNPRNRNKYIGIFSGEINQNIFDMLDIGENEFKNLLRLYGTDSIYFDISCFGWYDYKIWNNSGNTLFRGYFNDNWQN